MFLEISQNSQENTCARASVGDSNGDSGIGVFLWILRNTFVTEHLWATASAYQIFLQIKLLEQFYFTLLQLYRKLLLFYRNHRFSNHVLCVCLFKSNIWSSHLYEEELPHISPSHPYRFIMSGIHYWIKMYWIFSDFSKLIISK